MTNLRSFKQKLATITRLCDENDYDAAFAEVELAIKNWPGNSHLYVVWARLLQLQEESSHDLDEAKQALHRAMELDRDSPDAAIELGHFLDNVEDDPRAALKVFAEGVAAARRLLVEGLIGQAKMFQQLDQREEFHRCLLELLHLTQFETSPNKSKSDVAGAGVVFESPMNHFYAIQLKGPHAKQIQELLSEAVANSSA